MTQKLTDMQLVLLATACQREDGSLLPPPSSLGAQAARIRKAVTALIKRSLATECEMAEQAKAWREEDERHIGVVITDAGRAVIAAEEQNEAEQLAPPADAETEEAPAEQISEAAEVIEEPAPEETETQAIEAASVPRTGTKQALVLEMLGRAGGANLEELVGATGWLPHTTRAALTGLRKKGHAITRVGETGASRYQIVAA